MRVSGLLVATRRVVDSRHQLPPGRRRAARGAQHTKSSTHDNNIIHNEGIGVSRTSNTTSSAQRRGQRRAAPFRNRNETFRASKLVGSPRDTRIVREQGKMGLVKHEKIWQSLREEP